MDLTTPPPNDSEQTGPKKEAPNAIGDKIDALIATVVEINNANRKADDSHHQSNERHENGKKWREVAEIFLVAVYAIVTVCEWRTFDSERQTMETEFRTSQTNSMVQLAEMRQEQTFDQRAWIKFYGMACSPALQPPNSCYFFIHYKNIGKTPARNVVVGFNVVTNINAVVPFTKITNSDPQILFPDEDSRVDTAVSPMPNIVVNGIVARKETIIAYGIVWYDDVFGNHHWYRFSWVWDPNTGVTYPTVKDNETDDSEPKSSN